MDKGQYRFEIMHEAVGNTDAFSDQTHKRTADSIFDLMELSDKGITIGLEGGWGSGKSTVVNLLKQRLIEKDVGTLFFLFDAWAHEGDPLRRIFLEGLIEEIDSAGHDKALSELKNEISGRKKTIEVKTKKSTSTLGGWLSFSAIFVPVGAAILSSINYDQLSFFSLDRSIHVPSLFGFILSLFPLWTLLIWGFFGEEKKPEDKGYKTNKWPFGNKKWDIFESDSEEKFTQDITEDGERTSIEFEQFFKKIMAHSVGEDKRYKRALIVIDNLDRVDADQTLAIWSILQTFFQHRNSNSNRDLCWASKLWFLIPHDREGLSRVWNKSESFGEKSTQVSETNLTTSGDTIEQLELAPSFLEKCFQVVAEVPEPVMSAWVEYCEKHIKQSLTGWPEDQVQEVIEVFKRLESRLESSPTPRQILSFINRVGLLGIRFGGEMSAEAIALYALVRKNRSDREMRSELLRVGLPDEYQAKNDNQFLKSELAGMLFGVDRKKGIQLLLEPEIKGALNNGDSEKISGLIEDHGEGFWIVWEAINNSCLPNGHTEEYRIAVTTAFCQGISGRELKAERSIQNLVSEWKDNSDEWDLSKYDYSVALEALLKVSKDRKILESWLEGKVKQELKACIDRVDKEDFNPSSLPHISKLIVLLEKHGIEFPQLRYSNLDENVWGTWRSALNDEGVEIPSVLPKKGTIEAISNGLDTTNPNTDKLNLLIYTLQITANNNEWEAAADTLFNWAITPNRQPNNNIAYGLMLNIYLKCNKSAQEKIAKAIEHSHFIQVVQQEDISSVSNLLNLCAVILEGELLTSILPENLKTFWKSEYDRGACEQVTSKLKELNFLPILWKLATDLNNKVAIGIIRSGEYDKLIFASTMGPEFIDELEWVTEKELKEFFSKFLEFGGLAAAKETLVSDPVTYSRCLEIIAKHGGSVGLSIVRAAILNVKSSDWVKSLEQDSSLFNCIDEEKGNHEFKDGFLELIQKQLQEGKLSNHIWSNLGRLHSKVMDQEDVSKALTKCYFGLEADPLDDRAFEQVWSIVKNQLSTLTVDSIMLRIEDWLSNLKWERINSYLDTKTKIEGEPKESLVSRVRAMIGEADEDQTHTLSQLAKHLQIEIPRSENGGDSDAKS